MRGTRGTGVKRGAKAAKYWGGVGGGGGGGGSREGTEEREPTR